MKLSSAGLIYAHFGKRVIASVLNHQGPDTATVDAIFPQLYSCFVSEVDAIDNGTPISNETPKYAFLFVFPDIFLLKYL